MSGIDSPPDQLIIDALQRRTAERLRELSDDAVFSYIADAVYMERRRLENDREDATPEYEKRLEAAARATQQGRAAQERALLDLVAHYSREIHNRFSERTYSFATKVLPGALTRLLTAAQPTQLLGADFDPASRLGVQGPVETLRTLAETHTLVLTPTHLSNLDSPLIGYALHQAGLPPCIYGAGLNLFSNPAMSFFMSRLGAYTVDRRKQLQLYKHVLKDYSIEAIGRGAHSLFFPGGTRSRSGLLETGLKKGLLGTAITAWQDNLESGKANPGILVVPCTLTFALVLEAEEMLIEDALAADGKARYIITDDEFSEARTVASFARRVLNLDASTYIRFGTPLDLLGNPVDAEGYSLAPTGERIDARAYVTDREDVVIRDPQRDRVYTDRLAEAISRAYFRDNIALSTHVSGFVAWNLLKARHPRLDVYHRVVLGRESRWLSREAMLAGISSVVAGIQRLQQAGRIQSALPGGAEAILADALGRFSGFHKVPALSASGDRILVGPRLALYYSNRLVGYGLEEELS